MSRTIWRALPQIRGVVALRMDHDAHEPGRDPDCPECLAFSYEPAWYRSLLTERASLREPLVIQEAEGMEVVIPEASLPEVVVPDLEEARPEDEDR